MENTWRKLSTAKLSRSLQGPSGSIESCGKLVLVIFGLWSIQPVLQHTPCFRTSFFWGGVQRWQTAQQFPMSDTKSQWLPIVHHKVSSTRSKPPNFEWHTAVFPLEMGRSFSDPPHFHEDTPYNLGMAKTPATALAVPVVPLVVVQLPKRGWWSKVLWLERPRSHLELNVEETKRKRSSKNAFTQAFEQKTKIKDIVC